MAFCKNVKFPRNFVDTCIVTKPLYSVEKEAHCQFVRRADGKLVRLNLRLPMSVRTNHNPAPGHVTPALTSDWLQVYGAAPLPPLEPATAAAAERIPVPDVAPLDPCVSLHATNIYQVIF